MKVVFLGTPPFTEPIIEELGNKFDLIRIIRNPKELNNETIEQLNNLSPDFLVVAAFGKILPSELLRIPKLGSINIHPSLLPKYRGPSPIQEAIINGDKNTGVTFIKMDDQVDHGSIIEQVDFPILPDDTFESLADRLFKKSTESLEDVVSKLNKNQTIIQDDSKASYTKLLTKQDGFLDPQTLEIGNLKLEIERAVRAFYPWPSVWTKYKMSNNNKEVIIKFLPNNQIQVEGKNPMSYKDFKNGYESAEELLIKLNLLDAKN